MVGSGAQVKLLHVQENAAPGLKADAVGGDALLQLRPDAVQDAGDRGGAQSDRAAFTALLEQAYDTQAAPD